MADEAPTTEQPAEAPSLSLIAKQAFGSNFYGEVPDPEPETETEPEQEVQEEPETEPEQEIEAEAESEGSEEEPISSLDELVEHYEWDPEWVNTIKVKTKVDGETSAVPMKELIDSYQMNQAADKRLEEAKTKAQSQTQEFEQKSNELHQHFMKAGKLIENAENLLTRDSEKVNWDRLREDDPAEYSAKKAEMQERRQEIERMKQEAVEGYQQAIDSQQGYSDEDMKAMRQQQLQALAEKVPEVKDPDKAKEWEAQTARYLVNNNFTQEELKNALDHRFFVLAHKARLYDEGQKKVDTAKKKVAKVPKMTKPGTAKNQQEQADSKKVGQARKRLKETGDVRDALRYLKAKSGG